MADKTEWVVNGFQFGTQQDAELAQNEKIRIERLEAVSYTHLTLPTK